MTLSDSMLKALNDQIGMEFSSGYLYLAMAAQFDYQDLPGFAKWMKIQSKEETSHGMKLFEYVAARNGRVSLNPIPHPQADFGSPADTFKTVLEHERKVSASIQKLYELALTEKDFATVSQLQWFINEQVEEEATAERILKQIQALGGQAHLILMMDHQLGSRTD